jgi:D-alanyl-D-alanine carboxypeptidase
MTDTARLLGMKNSIFKNASGLPHSEQVTTAFDMAKLGIALRRDFPHYYDMFAETSFTFNGKLINSHNQVLMSYQWADGLKTGFVNAAGFNLITSTNREDGKLIGVVMGGPTPRARDSHMVKLLDFGYNRLNNRMLANSVNINTPSPTEGVFAVAARDVSSRESEDHLVGNTKSAFEIAAQNFHSKITSVGVSDPASAAKPKINSKNTKKLSHGKKAKSKKISSKSKRRV